MEFTFSLSRLLFQQNFSSIIAVLLMMAFIHTNLNFSGKVNRFFIFACFFSFILTISDSTRFVTAHMESPNIFRYISAGVGYAVRPTIIFFLSIIAGRYEKKNYFIISIPLIVCVFSSIFSIFPISHGIMFSFAPDNSFVRGPLGYLTHIVSAFYAFLFILYTVRNKKKNVHEILVVIIVVIAAFVAAYLEHAFAFDFILSQVYIIGIIIYYLYLVVQTFKTDNLTQLSTRRSFYIDLDNIHKSSFIILSMDLLNLKSYNDSLGHAAGDKVLVTVSDYIFKHFSKYAKVYRTGGDDFKAIFINQSEEEIKTMVEKFQKDLENSELKVACGLAKYKAGDSLEKIITIADERMYSNKVQLKNQDAF